MSILARFSQQPNEHRRRQLDYTAHLALGEKLSTVAIQITDERPEGADPEENPFVVDTTSFDSATEKKFTYFAGGSVDSAQVTLTFTFTTTDGQTIEDEVIYNIREWGAVANG